MLSWVQRTNAERHVRASGLWDVYIIPITHLKLVLSEEFTTEILCIAECSHINDSSVKPITFLKDLYQENAVFKIYT